MSATSMIVIWSIFPVIICILLLGFRAFKHKETMFLIERNRDTSPQNRPFNKNILIIWAAILLGASLGIITGMIVCYIRNIDAPIAVVICFATMLLFIGAALLFAYRHINKRELK